MLIEVEVALAVVKVALLEMLLVEVVVFELLLVEVVAGMVEVALFEIVAVLFGRYTPYCT